MVIAGDRAMHGELDLVEDEVMKMADWPCEAFQGPSAGQVMGPACKVSWIHCNVPYDTCGKGSCP